MAISARAAGAWAELTVDATVAIPVGAVTGDRMFLLATWKAYSVTATVADWTEITEFADGAVAAGSGTGSVKVGAWYKDHDGSEADPTLDFSAGVIASAVIVVFAKDATETWFDPAFATAAIAAATTWSATGNRDVGIIAGDLAIELVGFRDDSSTMTRVATTALDAAGVTWAANYVEYPATHFSTTTGNDLSADAGYRLASSGTSTAAPTGTGVLLASETGAALFIRQRAAVLDCYYDSVIADSPVGYWRLGEPSGTNANDEIGTADGTYQATPTLGVAGALTGDSDTAVTLVKASSEYISVPDGVATDLGNVFSIEFWIKRTSLGAIETIISKGSGAYIMFLLDTNLFRLSHQEFSDIVDSTVAIADTTTWHHVVATHNATTAKLYLDGVDVTGTVLDDTLTNNAGVLNIGRRTTQADLYLGASLDEVALYNAVLTREQVAEHYAARIVACGGTEFNQAVDGALTPAGSFVRTVARFLSGSAGTPAGSLVRTVSKFFTGSAGTPSGVARKTGVKQLAGSAGTPAGAFVKTPVKQFAGSAGTPAGSLGPRVVLLHLSGGLTPAGSLVKTASTHLSSSAGTPAGALVATGVKELAGSGGTPAGSLVLTVSQHLDGALTPAGSLVRTVAQFLAGTVTAGAVVVRTGLLHLGGSTDSSGTLTKSRSVYVTGTLEPAADVATSATKALTGTWDTAGAVARSILTHFSGAVTTAGAVVKAASTVVSGTVTASGDVSDTATRIVSGTVDSASSLGRAASTHLAGTLTPAGSLVRAVSVTLSGAFDAVGSIVKAVGKILTGSVDSSGELTATPEFGIQYFTGSVDSSGSVVQTPLIHLTGADTPTGAIQQSVLAQFSGAIAPIGQVVYSQAVTLDGTVNLVGLLRTTPAVTFTADVMASGLLIRSPLKHLSSSATWEGEVPITPPEKRGGRRATVPLGRRLIDEDEEWLLLLVGSFGGKP